MTGTPTILIDADACPVKEEIYRVAARFKAEVRVVSNSPFRIPDSPRVKRVVVDDTHDLGRLDRRMQLRGLLEVDEADARAVTLLLQELLDRPDPAQIDAPRGERKLSLAVDLGGTGRHAAV